MICPICKHKYEEWNADKMEMEYEHTEPFIKISNDMSLYACPICCNVIYDGDCCFEDEK